MQELGENYELIYVDDGSKDKTAHILKELHDSDHHVKLLRFSRNFGHQIAATAGINFSSGDAVILIDADLQDPPELIRDMVDLWRQGYEVVYGQRIERDGEKVFKLWAANLFYRLINRLSEVYIPLDSGDFRLMDRKVVRVFNSMPERDRFLRGMISWVGFRQKPLPYRRAARFAGKTGYTLWKMIKLATDGILSFSQMPLRLATSLGFLTSSLSIIGILYAFLLRIFTNIWVSGWTLLFIAVLFMGGVQLICLGVIGEYIGRNYYENKQRPLYVLEEALGFDTSLPDPGKQ
jgi:dolichol-phosphate mannosyltransferase